MSQWDEEFTFTWSIKNYTFYCKKNEHMFFSPIFTAENLCGSKWSIVLYPKGFDTFGEYVSLELCRKGYGEILNEMEMKFKFEICDEEGEMFAFTPEQNIELDIGSQYYLPDVIMTKELEKKLENSSTDNLVIRCWICLQKKPIYVAADEFTFTWHVNFHKQPDWSGTKTFTIYEETKFQISLKAPQDYIWFEICQIGKELSPSNKVKCEVTLFDAEFAGKIKNFGSFFFAEKSSIWYFPFYKKSSLNDEFFRYRFDTIFLEFKFLIRK